MTTQAPTPAASASPLQHIESVTHCLSGNTLMVGEHRYGSGWAAAVLPEHRVNDFERLMTASGSEPFMFSYNAYKVPELPWVFAGSAGEALRKLEALLASGKAHDPSVSIQVLLEVVKAARYSNDEDWSAPYYKAYGEFMGAAA